jgi:broad specificity phosphatase PhoE
LTTRVYLIRHASTTFAAEDRFAGASNVPLSEAGRTQARRLAERLTKHPPAAVYCSPMERTMETAALVAGPHGLTPNPRDGLKEINHGHWEGLTRAEVLARYRQEIETWDDDPFGFAPEGGESGMSVMGRAIPAIREIVAAHPNQVVYVVSHKATNRILIGYYLGLELKGFRDRIDQQPACLNILDFKDQSRARLMLLNDVSHYDSEPVNTHVHLSPWWANEIQNPG